MEIIDYTIKHFYFCALKYKVDINLLISATVSVIIGIRGSISRRIQLPSSQWYLDRQDFIAS